MRLLVSLTPVAWLAACLAVLRACPTNRPEIDLWPEGTPGLKADVTPERSDAEGHIWNIHHPSLTVFRADHPNGTAVIICPGGSYLRLSFREEGTVPAQWLNSLGVSAFILKYRLNDYGQPAPLQDVLRAIRLLRFRSKIYALRPDRIGVLGFSAGGHLAASAGTMFDDRLGNPPSPLDRVSGRPDFLMLAYPVITMQDPFAHAGSRTNLLGPNPSQQLKERWSADRRVDAHTAPTFLVTSEADRVVPIQNSLGFYVALAEAGVTAELHVFERGPHGFALHPGYGPTSEWPPLAADWMRSHGWLPP